MSNKRAAIRRELKLRDKINHKAENGDYEAIAAKLFAKGYDHGITVGTAVIFMALNSLYGFCHTKNGKGKLDKLIEEIRVQSANMQHEPNKFTCEYYVRML